MNNYDFVSQRLHNQRLSVSDFQRPVDVVHWLGAVQAQEFNGAKWAIGQRMGNVTDAAIEQAYNDGKILRTHIMRPTWHFVAPDDIRWLLKLTAPRVNIACGSNYRKLELDDRTFTRCNRMFTRALRDGQYLTRSSLRRILNESGVAADDSVRLAHILLRAELDGIICSGPRVGNQVTYALLDERVPQQRALDRDNAVAKLTRRYFTSHGPATLQDYIWWSGLRVADAKSGIAMVEQHLTKLVWQDKVYWGPPWIDVGEQSGKSGHLLPAFDEYTVAYRDRKAMLDLDHNTLSTQPNGLLGPSVILNGKIIGSWKQSNNTQSASIDVKLFGRLTKSEKSAIKAAAERYLTFRGLPRKTGVVHWS